MVHAGDDLLLLLSDIARLVRVEADRRARVHGLTRAQWVILKSVARAPGLSQRELAELLEVEPMTVGRLTDRLEARGLVERRPDSADRRIWRLHLLPGADPVLSALDVLREEIADLLCSGLSAARIDALKQTLSTMRANLLSTRRAPARPASVSAPISALDSMEAV
jgi:DNA-binding MarR family transcriptional regulator